MDRIPMSIDDLDRRFQIDCKRKQQQIEMLQSMRQSGDESFDAYMRVLLQPWRIFTNPAELEVDLELTKGNPNKYINYHLHQLRYCP
jgi:hypothetical protein